MRTIHIIKEIFNIFFYQLNLFQKSFQRIPKLHSCFFDQLRIELFLKDNQDLIKFLMQAIKIIIIILIKLTIHMIINC